MEMKIEVAFVKLLFIIYHTQVSTSNHCIRLAALTHRRPSIAISQPDIQKGKMPNYPRPSSLIR